MTTLIWLVGWGLSIAASLLVLDVLLWVLRDGTRAALDWLTSSHQRRS
jgi:hypothetical protein